MQIFKIWREVKIQLNNKIVIFRNLRIKLKLREEFFFKKKIFLFLGRR